MKDQKQNYNTDDCSNSLDETSANLKDVEDNIYSPFKLGKIAVGNLINKYFTKKFSEDIDCLQEKGGINWIETSLKTSSKNGIVDNDNMLITRIGVFDSNQPAQEKPINYCEFVLAALGDTIIITLIICAIVQTTLQTLFGDHPSKDWIDGMAIILAIIVVVLVGSINNYIKESEFREFQKSVIKDRKINIVRHGEDITIQESELLVGDLMKLEEGMTVPVDCVLVKGNNITIDESAMTGEIDPVEKAPLEECIKIKEAFLIKYPDYILDENSHNKIKSPIIPSGTLVTSGSGNAIVLAVGPNSEKGKIIATIEANKSEDEATPLQEKLVEIAELIGWLGLICAVITSIAMAIKVYLMFRETSFTKNDAHFITRIFIIGVVVIVVAIPEGLPLAVTITLALSIKKMLKDKNLVRTLDACETMGGANYICTDKTGTLTKNEMNIVKIYDCKYDQNVEETCSDDYTGNWTNFFTNEKKWNLIKLSFVCNTATEIDSEGNETSTFKTDLTFTKFARKLGENIKQLRNEYIKPINNDIPRIPFSSKRKKMSTILTSKDFTNKYRLFTKGASEILLNSCKYYLDENGNKSEINDDTMNFFQNMIQKYSEKTLRTICVCYKDLTEEEAYKWNHKEEILDDNNMLKELFPIEEDNLTLVAIVGIRDVLKEEVKEAVVKCQNAGITVIMITGDNIDTALAIAQECYIAHDKSEAILGDKFMEKIGGVVCENCFPKNEYLGNFEEMIKISNEKRIKKDYKSLMKDINYSCECYRTKNEAILKIKSKLKEEVLRDDPDKYAEIVRDSDKKAKFDKELEDKAEAIIEESKIKIRKDIIANIGKFNKLIEKKRVIARSHPNHKYALITGLKENDHVVAVTGDGTNDAPALSKADVGFAMGKGTDIAKEASDIIIVDDNFSSIVNAIKWGRNIYDNIRRFLQFQLTVNIVACILVFIGVCAGSESPLSAVQMLWLNMIMDSLGSLALATEEPTEELLNREPYKRGELIVNKKMFKHVIGQALVQLTILLFLLFCASKVIYETNPIMINYGYQFARCFNYDLIPHSPIINFEEPLTNKNIYLITGFESLFANADSNTFTSLPGCIGAFQGNDNLKSAYHFFLSDIFSTTHFTIVFNTFVFLQLFNEINCRILDDRFNIFYRVTTNKWFISIWLIEVVLQICIIQFSGSLFHVVKGGLSLYHWGICLGIAFVTTFTVNFLLKLIPEEGCKKKNDIQGYIHIA